MRRGGMRRGAQKKRSGGDGAARTVRWWPGVQAPSSIVCYAAEPIHSEENGETMRRHQTMLIVLCATLLAANASRSQHNGGGGRKSAGAGTERQRGSHSERMGGPTVLRPVPITRPVDLIWPPVIIEPPEYAHAYSPYPAEPAGDPQPAAPVERGVEVRLDDCMENAGLAGYNFSGRRVVSCEDSTVDIYLSFNDDGNYFFLVPGDTKIKDVGPHNEIRSIRFIKPGNWSANQGAQLTAGHVYVVWAYSGDLYLVKVDALWEKHVMFSWLWHSHLSQVDAEKFLKDNADGPSRTPYFKR
jgi:hypothetical protein